jgi:HK97 family phage major capsid protein
VSTKEGLRQQANELAAEVKAKSAAFEAGELTAAEFSTAMDHIEAKNAEIESAMKAYDRAARLSGGADMLPAEVADMPVDTRVKAVAEAYDRIKAAATGHSRDSVDFEIGFKTQGVASLMGEAASGTSAPSALSGYFLGGAAGPAIVPEFVPGITELRFYPNVIAELFPTMPVSGPVVTYVRETAWANNAAGVAEGATKPTSTNSLTRYTEQVGKVAALARVTDELIADAPAFWSLIQQRLAQGVVRQEEVQLLAGGGMPGVNGLLNRTTGFTKPQTVSAVTNLVVPAAATPGAGAGTSTVSSVTPGREVTGTNGAAPTGVQIAEGILAALTDIRVGTFFEPDAIVVNPSDYNTIRLAKDSTGQYLGGSFYGYSYGGAVNESSSYLDPGLTLWGKRVVSTPAIPAGYVLVGSFSDGGMVLRREGLRVNVTNTNGTDFEQNLWTARAESRVGLMIERPEVFELIKLTTAGS